ncbi:MAG: type II toxin-antitoxin system VapC family toxin [Chthoniobacterales bacterium]|nr:type II toxin-antitoxin system VapC family toxin [Chthoniobacterales bacterium]MCX7713956.1 type II toxin-antitoxin system VapC family toxin [Chthoniobacterales bacterium]
MKLLVDTRVMLLGLSNPEKIPQEVRRILEDSKNIVYVSAVSFWELAYKHQQKKVTIRGVSLTDLPRAVEEMGWKVLPLDPVIAASFSDFKHYEEQLDVFERMLVWLAIKYQLEFVTANSEIKDLENLKVYYL